MRVLIIDTTAFVQDFRLRGHAFTVLLGNLGVVTDVVAIPKVVLDEATHKYSFALQNKKGKIQALTKDIRRLTEVSVEYL